MTYIPDSARRTSRRIRVGDVPVGGDVPILVQSMMHTDACDVDATVAQVRPLQKAGVDIARVSVTTKETAENFGKIGERAAVPLVADIQFDHRIALGPAEPGVECLRDYPGNIERRDRVQAMGTQGAGSDPGAQRVAEVEPKLARG